MFPCLCPDWQKPAFSHEKQDDWGHFEQTFPWLFTLAAIYTVSSWPCLYCPLLSYKTTDYKLTRTKHDPVGVNSSKVLLLFLMLLLLQLPAIIQCRAYKYMLRLIIRGLLILPWTHTLLYMFICMHKHACICSQLWTEVKQNMGFNRNSKLGKAERISSVQVTSKSFVFSFSATLIL